MGSENSCPECPKCEQKECPECPKCNDSWSIADNIKWIPVSGTPFTIIKMDLTGPYPDDDDLAPVFQKLLDLAPSLIIIVTPSPDIVFDKSDKIGIIALHAPIVKNKGYFYSDRGSYEKMKKASIVLNNVLKEYPNWFIRSAGQKDDYGFTTIINGDILVKRYDEYQPLFTMDDYGDTLYESTLKSDEDVGFALKEGINTNDVDLRLAAVFYPERNKFKKNALSMVTPQSNPEKFCTFSNNYYCLIVTIIVLLLIGIGLYILFSEGDESVRRKNTSEKQANVGEER